MTLSLGGITLSDHLTLDIKSAGVAYSQRRLIGGAQVIQADGNDGGRTLVLNSEGHLLCTHKEQIRAMQAAGLAVILEHPRGTFSVLIIDTDSLVDDMPRVDPENDTELTCSGDITLIEVS